MPREKKHGQKQPENRPQTEAEEVGHRHPGDASKNDELVIGYPHGRERANDGNRENEADAGGEGYEQERSGAV